MSDLNEKNINSLDEELFEADKLVILDPKELTFSKEESGFMTLVFQGKTYKKINLTRLQPFYSKFEYVSVNYENDEKEFIEVGVIRDIREMSKEQFELIDNFLEYKYYMPLITKVYSIKENMRGSLFVKAATNAGEKTLCIRDWYRNFKLIGGKYLYVCDVDGNKYYCDDIEKRLDKKSVANIELFT